MGHNKKIDFEANGFIAVTDSVHLLKKLKFDAIFVDEGHHPLPPKMPGSTELYLFSATHRDEPDFRYTMGQAIEDGVLCDYDIMVPALTAHHAYVCLGDLLLKQVGRFRRVLAYCNSVSEAKRFRMVLRELGLAAWHINAKTPSKKREAVIEEFTGPLQKPVHVLVTVEVLGEGINIPNADTCMFVEPRNSYRSIIQAIGRVLRHHPAKTLAHIVLPAVAIPNSRSASVSPASGRSNLIHARECIGGVARLQDRKSETEVGGCTGQGSEHFNGLLEPYRGTNLHPSSVPEHEMFPRPKSLAEISLCATPATAQETINAGVQAKTQQDAKPCCEHAAGFESKFRDKKGSSIGLTRRVNQTVVVARDWDDQQDGKSIGSDASRQTLRRILGVGSSEGCAACQREFAQIHEPERVNADACDPCVLDRPASIQAQQLSSQKQVPVWKWPREIRDVKAEVSIGLSGTMLKSERLGPRALQTAGGSLRFDQQYGSQVERFLAMLMLADHRLVGTTAGHRIQVADCTLANAGVTVMDGVTTEIYSQLTAILSQADPWEARLKTLETFVTEHGRVPAPSSDDSREKSLGYWLHNQGCAFKAQRMPVQRFQKLLASLPPIRRRAEGWQMGDTDQRFRENCEELREYMRLHERLPPTTRGQLKSSVQKLAAWLRNIQRLPGTFRSYRKNMLEEVHPLVKALVQKWENTPAVVKRPRWEQRLRQLSRFVSSTGRLPKSTVASKSERSCCNWLQVQRRQIRAGHLPDELAQQLRSSDSLIASYLDAPARTDNDPMATFGSSIRKSQR